jgi:hypothetical protein
MNPTAQTDEHRWLEQLVGEWTWDSDASEPGKPKVILHGVEMVRSLGGLWLLAESRGDAPGGGEHRTLLTLGYDPDKKRFVGSFVSSFLSTLWLYEGTRKDNRLVLESVGPGMSGDGSTAKYEDTIELQGPTERAFISRVQETNGTWTEFQRTQYRRRT